MVGQLTAEVTATQARPASKSRPLSIALLSWESMHSIAVGGLAAHVTELAGALDRRGHNVHLFTRMGEGQAAYDYIEGVHYHRCPFDPHTDDFLEFVTRMCDSFVHHVREVEDATQPFDIVRNIRMEMIWMTMDWT